MIVICNLVNYHNIWYVSKTCYCTVIPFLFVILLTRTGLVIVAAGVLIATKPYLDKLRSQDEQNNVQIAKPRVKTDDE